jgi:prophage DNA circulation protein
MAHSEVIRLREQIERECEAMRLLSQGYAVAASHAIIRRKYEQLGKYQEQLASLVGEHEAMQTVVETYTKVVG